jgi:hypothetical protein
MNTETSTKIEATEESPLGSTLPEQTINTPYQGMTADKASALIGKRVE